MILLLLAANFFIVSPQITGIDNTTTTAKMNQENLTTEIMDEVFDYSRCIQFSQVNITIPQNEAQLQHLQIAILSIVLLIGTIGNLLVIYVIIKNKKLKTVTNMYLLNLAIADLIYLQAIPFYIVTLIKQQWIFEIVLCKIYYIFTGINQFTGIFILTVLAFDRYLAVCHPIAAINWRKLASSRIILTIVWLISILFMIPVILYSDVDSTLMPTNMFNMTLNDFGKPNSSTDTYDCVIKPTCTIKWPSESIIKTELAFVTYGFIISFFCPVALITIFYFNVVLRLKRGSKIHTYSSERQRARRKVTVLVLTVISVYILTFAPFWIFQVVLTAYYINNPNDIPSESFHRITAHLSGFFQFLLYLNSTLNPYVYAFLSEGFRNSFRTVISSSFLCCSGETDADGFAFNSPRQDFNLVSRTNRLKSITLNDGAGDKLPSAQFSHSKRGSKNKKENFSLTKKILQKKLSLDNSLYHSQPQSASNVELKPILNDEPINNGLNVIRETTDQISQMNN